jgi:hypothetical protein
MLSVANEWYTNVNRLALFLGVYYVAHIFLFLRSEQAEQNTLLKNTPFSSRLIFSLDLRECHA